LQSPETAIAAAIVPIRAYQSPARAQTGYFHDGL
jgi:hypothetical protein